MERSMTPPSTADKTTPTPNGDGPRKLTKEQLADRTRFRFREEELELSELGGSVTLKSLTVGEREALPDLQDEKGRPAVTVAKLAELLAAIMAEPKVTAEEAAQFLPDWPAESLDEVLFAYGRMNGSEEEMAAAAKEFRESQ